MQRKNALLVEDRFPDIGMDVSYREEYGDVNEVSFFQSWECKKRLLDSYSLSSLIVFLKGGVICINESYT